MLSAVYGTVKHCFPHIQWLESENNYMLENLGHARQKDGYSCGSYVSATAVRLTVNTRSIPAFEYRHGCDSCVTGFVRNAAVVAFFQRVTEFYTRRASNAPQGPNRDRYLNWFTGLDLYSYIYKKKYGYVGRNNERQLFQRTIHWNNSDFAGSGVVIADITQYLMRLRQYGIKFQRR